MKTEIDFYIRRSLSLMEGWCTEQKAEALVESVVKHKPAVVVEIGVFAGRSLIAMALACKMNGNGGIVYGIDPWLASASVEHQNEKANSDWWGKLDHDKIYRQCLAACTTFGVLDQTVLIRAKSDQVTPLFFGSRPRVDLPDVDRPMIDMLHIDGNHSEETSTYDVTNYVPLVRPGGIVVFDDTNWGTTKKAQELLAELCTFERFIGKDSGQECAWYAKK